MSPIPRERLSAALVGALVASSMPVPVTAQLPGAATEGLRQIERLPAKPLPEPGVEPTVPGPPLRLPPVVPSPEERARPYAGLRVFVREIVLSGSTVFSPEELSALTAPYENREITSEELEELRQGLTRLYIEHGYINSGAVLPDQTVADGVIRITIVEGTLTDIELEGNVGLQSRYVSERFALSAGPPLNVNALQERLQLLLQTPFIERINADLTPGDRPGEAKLKARVAEATPHQITVTVDNELSPSQGEVRGLAHGTLYNLTGWGDRLNAEVAFAEGLKDFSLDYSHPITARDTTLSLFVENSRSKVVEEPFDLLDIESEFWSIGMQLTHPLYRTPQQLFTVSAGLDSRHSQTSLLGQGFPFSQGVSNDGESDVTVIRLSQEWLDRSRTQVLAARSTFSIGIDALGATSNQFGPDGEFLTWLGQFQWVRRIGDTGVQALFRGDVQWSNKPLLPLEQFAVGGATSVRGYRENQLVRDWGYSTSLEVRIPVPGFNGQGERPTLYVAPFVDLGGAWNVNRPTPEPRTIASAGLGLRWDPHPRVHAELYWGYAFNDDDIVTPSDTLQDSGIHFLVSANLFE